MVIGGLLMASGVVVHDGILDADNLLRRLRGASRRTIGFLVLARAMQGNASADGLARR